MFRPQVGMPKVVAERLAKHLAPTDLLTYLIGGKIIDGAKTRDPNNTDARDIRAGTLMGIVTATGKYANTVIGSLSADAAAAATTVNIGLAEAAELVRRVGATGTLRFVGPPTAGGTVATFTETYSAVNVGTGDVTVSALDAALEASSFVTANDGTHLPVTFIPDGWGEYIPEDSVDIPFSYLPIRGNVDTSKLLPFPADLAIRQWIRDRLRDFGNFVFTDKY